MRRAASLTLAQPLPSPSVFALPQLALPVDAAAERARIGLEALFHPPAVQQSPFSAFSLAAEDGSLPADSVLAVLERMQDFIASHGCPSSRGLNGARSRHKDCNDRRESARNSLIPRLLQWTQDGMLGLFERAWKHESGRGPFVTCLFLRQAERLGLTRVSGAVVALSGSLRSSLTAFLVASVFDDNTVACISSAADLDGERLRRVHLVADLLGERSYPLCAPAPCFTSAREDHPRGRNSPSVITTSSQALAGWDERRPADFLWAHTDIYGLHFSSYGLKAWNVHGTFRCGGLGAGCAGHADALTQATSSPRRGQIVCGPLTGAAAGLGGDRRRGCGCCGWRCGCRSVCRRAPHATCAPCAVLLSRHQKTVSVLCWYILFSLLSVWEFHQRVDRCCLVRNGK